MKRLLLAISAFLMLCPYSSAVEFQDDVLRYGGTLTSVNRAGDEITVRDTPRGAERTIRVEPRLARALNEGSHIYLPAVTFVDTGSRLEESKTPAASAPSEAAAAND